MCRIYISIYLYIQHAYISSKQGRKEGRKVGRQAGRKEGKKQGRKGGLTTFEFRDTEVGIRS